MSWGLLYASPESMERDNEAAEAVSLERFYLLDASPRNPQCCLETSGSGRLRLLLRGQLVPTASASSKDTFISPQISSLSILYEEASGRSKHIPIFSEDDDDDYVRACVITGPTEPDGNSQTAAQNSMGSSDPNVDPEVATILEIARGLRDKLEECVQTESRKLQLLLHSDTQSVRPVQTFLHLSEKVFDELMTTIHQTGAQKQTDSLVVAKELCKRDSMPYQRNAAIQGEYTMSPLQELEDLKIFYSPEQIVRNITEDQKEITLQYEDHAGRVHHMILTFSSSLNNHSKIMYCQVDLPKEALVGFPVPIYTFPCEETNGILSWNTNKRQKVADTLDGIHSSSLLSAKSRTPFPFATSLSLLSRKPNNEQFTTITAKNKISVGYQAFRKIVDDLQDLWDELNDLDKNCCILEPLSSSETPIPRCLRHRRVQLTESVSMLLSLNIYHPRHLPEAYHFVFLSGKYALTLSEERLRKRLEASDWKKESSVRDNLECCLGIALPSPYPISKEPDKHDDQMLKSEEIGNGKECGVCYTVDLMEGETQQFPQGQGELPSIPCENSSCGRMYHERCLQEWLESLTSSRITFDVILGECPYCNGPISAPMRGV